MTYFHATTEDNAKSIYQDKKIKCGMDGIVYLADSLENAIKFTMLRMCDPIIILEIEIPDPSKVIETFDHSESFFQCRSWGYPEDISTDCIKGVWRQKLSDLF